MSLSRSPHLVELTQKLYAFLSAFLRKCTLGVVDVKGFGRKLLSSGMVDVKGFGRKLLSSKLLELLQGTT
jgi:hypothetical protein